VDDNPWIAFFALLTVGANVATVTLWVLAIGARFGAGRELWARVRDSLAESGLLIAAVVAATSMAGSLYLSEGAHFVPCLMCWYQRIAMYSLAVILVLAAARRDWGVRPYALALALLGLVISLYHYVIERQPSLEIGGDGTCAAYGPPCTTRWIDDQFGYISIPFMALSAFLLVASVLAAARVSAPDHDGQDGEPDADEPSEFVTTQSVRVKEPA
jgi:disulfide bond formation protein DsbB